MLRLKEKYLKEIVPLMKEKFSYKNVMAVPRVEKVIINNSFGRLAIGKSAEEQKKIFDNILNDLTLISGQHALLTRAKKSISSFKLRQGMPIGVKVTLRKRKMYDFLDRLIHIALPRSRDFRGIDLKSVDKTGNLTLGIKEQISFPEISPEKTRFLFGFEVTVVTGTKTREESLELLRLLGLPLKKE